MTDLDSSTRANPRRPWRGFPSRKEERRPFWDAVDCHGPFQSEGGGPVWSLYCRDRLFATASLAEVWLLAVIAAFAVGIGVFAVWRGAKVAGMICFLTNAAVLALYGFIAAFFTLGVR